MLNKNLGTIKEEKGELTVKKTTIPSTGLAYKYNYIYLNIHLYIYFYSSGGLFG